MALYVGCILPIQVGMCFGMFLVEFGYLTPKAYRKILHQVLFYMRPIYKVPAHSANSKLM